MSEQDEKLESSQSSSNDNVQQTEDTTTAAPPQEKRTALDLAFPSASLLLDCAKDEYTKERERTQFLDNKASFFMSAIILVATIFVPFIPFDKVKAAMTSGTEIEKAVTYITGTSLIFSLAILVNAFKKLYDAYKIKGYERFNIENIVDAGVLATERNSMEKALCDNYKDAIEKNIKTNDDKAIKISDGIGKCAIGFMLLAIFAIILKFFIG